MGSAPSRSATPFPPRPHLARARATAPGRPRPARMSIRDAPEPTPFASSGGFSRSLTPDEVWTAGQLLCDGSALFDNAPERSHITQRDADPRVLDGCLRRSASEETG